MRSYRFAEETAETFDMAQVLMPTAQSAGETNCAAQNRIFECKTCNRAYSSFQALGGHRASHKRQRITEEGANRPGRAGPMKARVHECSICGLEFAIGQALGGHMRRHRPSSTSNEDEMEDEMLVLRLGTTIKGCNNPTLDYSPDHGNGLLFEQPYRSATILPGIHEIYCMPLLSPKRENSFFATMSFRTFVSDDEELDDDACS